MFHRSFLAALILCAMTVGCSTRYLTPITTWSVHRSGPYFQVKQKGVTLAMEPMSWRPSAKNLEGGLLPVRVRVVNGSVNPITVRRQNFQLTDQWWTGYAPWEPTHFYFNYSGSNFRFFYYGPFPFFWWWDDDSHFKKEKLKHRKWNSSKPAGENILPHEIILLPGESVEGVLIFAIERDQNQTYILRWKPDKPHAPFKIIFRVTTA